NPLTRSARRARFEIEFTSIGSFVDCADGDRGFGFDITLNVCSAPRCASGLVTVCTSTDAQAARARLIAASVARKRWVLMDPPAFRYVHATCHRRSAASEPGRYCALIDSRPFTGQRCRGVGQARASSAPIASSWPHPGTDPPGLRPAAPAIMTREQR